MQHRYHWHYLVGFVHPASGRTLFHRATTGSIALFEVELDAFACQAGASPTKQIVLVLDRAGWHASAKLRVPEQVHLLFLPAYSPELQPAEHLWPLTNTGLANRHFTRIDDLEDTQAERCVVLQARLDLIRSTTLFHWWPQRLKKRQEPRRNYCDIVEAWESEQERRWLNLLVQPALDTRPVLTALLVEVLRLYFSSA